MQYVTLFGYGPIGAAISVQSKGEWRTRASRLVKQEHITVYAYFSHESNKDYGSECMYVAMITDMVRTIMKI